MSSTNAIQATNSIASKPNGCQAGSVSNQSAWCYRPAIDVLEFKHDFTIRCDAPGIDPKQIDLTYEGGELALRAPVPARCGDNIQFLRQEFGVGDFERTIPLGRLAEFIDGDQIEASYRDGVISIRLPKLQVAKPRKISVATD